MIVAALSEIPLLLCGFAFLAGFVDSIAGGGGLIQLPALFTLLPGVPPALLLGTNKLSSIAGTAVAAGHYARHVKMDRRVLLPAAAAAFVFSYLGARVVGLLDPSHLRPLLLGLLVAVALYTFLKKDFGKTARHRVRGAARPWLALAIGVAIGFYDGFFGPGTGSFLMFLFISLFGATFLESSALSKAVNLSTNAAAVLCFAAHGQILYAVAIPMALCNILGSMLGSRLAILKGSPFVRVFFLLVVVASIAKFGWDTLAQ